MPLGKYFCDYCEKQFQDTASARRRHLTGAQHRRAKALWYDSFKDPHGGPLLQPDGSLGRPHCHHFVQKGACKYGDSCKYFHPKQNVLNPVQSPSGFTIVGPVQTPNFYGLRDGSSLSGDVLRDQMGVSWGNLPPSLLPPQEGGWPPLPFVDWG